MSTPTDELKEQIGHATAHLKIYRRVPGLSTFVGADGEPLYGIDFSNDGEDILDGKTQSGLGTGPGPGLGSASAVIATARQYIGTPYRYGGLGKQRADGTYDPIDCSRLLQLAFLAHGINIGRTTGIQITKGNPVSRENLLPGDRVFWLKPDRSRTQHTALYIGNDQIIHAGSKGVGITTLTRWEAGTKHKYPFGGGRRDI